MCLPGPPAVVELSGAAPGTLKMHLDELRPTILMGPGREGPMRRPLQLAVCASKIMLSAFLWIATGTVCNAHGICLECLGHVRFLLEIAGHTGDAGQW